MSVIEIFQPGMRHWKEFQRWQDDKILQVPAPGPGPDSDQVSVDLDRGIVTIRKPAELDETADSIEDGLSSPREAGQDVDQGRDENRAE